MDRDWAMLAGLVVLAYLAVLAGAIWGALQRTLQTTTQVAQRQQRVSRRQGAQHRVLRTKIQRTYTRLARLTAASTGGPQKAQQHSVERRYAGVLDQPMSAPNSTLLSMLELLAKDATNRRADDAILRRAVGDLRELIEMQQAEINDLRLLLTSSDDRASARASA